TKLKDWWTINGFDPKTGIGKGEESAAYLNYNDLGFGRDMHILQQGENVAAYVTNYGDPQNLQDLLFADLAAGKVDPSGRTVCMECSPVEGGEFAKVPVVKFYVYESRDPEAKRLTSANLDGVGEKFVPNLCLNCHGGDYDAVVGEAAGSAIKMKTYFRE